MDRDEARSLVMAEIRDFKPSETDEAVLLEDQTIEKPWGWVFFYKSRRFVDTGEFASRLLGNSPNIVDARSGKVDHTGTAFTIEHYIAEYERAHGLA